MDYLHEMVILMSCIMEIYMYNDFMAAYFERRDSMQERWKRIAVCISAMAVLYTVNLYGNTYLNLAGSVLLTGTLCTILYKAGVGGRVMSVLAIVLITFCCEFLYALFIWLPTYAQDSARMPDLSAFPWHILSMKLLTYIVFIIVKQFFGRSKKAIENKIFAYYLCIPVASLVIMLMNYYTGVDNTLSEGGRILLSTSFAMMIVGNITVFYAFNRYAKELGVTAEQKVIITRQEMDLQYYEQVQLLDDKYRKFIHDISHHLKTIGELAKENKNSNIISILQDLDIELEQNVLTIYSTNPVLNSVLSEKKSAGEKKGVPLDIYVEPGTNLEEVADADVITILSNLLDNAMRAAEQAEDKKVIVRIYSENEGYFHVIKIQNHFDGELINKEDGFETTKKEDGIHGVGLRSVKSTAEKYDGYLECFVEEDKFVAVVVLSM